MCLAANLYKPYYTAVQLPPSPLVLQARPTKKTEMCRGFVNGTCYWSSKYCKYAHSVDELNPDAGSLLLAGKQVGTCHVQASLLA